MLLYVDINIYYELDKLKDSLYSCSHNDPTIFLYYQYNGHYSGANNHADIDIMHLILHFIFEI